MRLRKFMADEQGGPEWGTRVPLRWSLGCV